MKRCTICGMENQANPAHGSNYKGIGHHTFSSTVVNDDLEDIIVQFGGEMKSLGEGKFEGYLVRFSSADDPDLVGDYFTKSTEFFVEDGATIPILYDHGLNLTMKKTKIGRATVKYDDAGLFIKGELQYRKSYEAFLKEIEKELIKPKKAGLSSGAASHMVERKQVKKGVNEILTWGIAEGSITPAPTEPRNEVVSLKSYFDSRDDPFSENVDTKAQTDSEVPGQEETDSNKTATGEAGKETKSDTSEEEFPEDIVAIHMKGSIKGLFEEKLKEKTPSIWETRSILDDVYRDIAKAASVSDITQVIVDVEAKVKEAKLEEAAREIPLVVKQINEWVEKGGTGNDNSKYFYIRSLSSEDLDEESIKAGLGNGLSLDEHSDRVVHAIEEFANLGVSLLEQVKAYQDRCVKKMEYRAKDPVKSGRSLSKATVNWINDIKVKNSKVNDLTKELDTSLTTLLEKAEPKIVPDVASVLQMEFALTRNQTELAAEGQL